MEREIDYDLSLVENHLYTQLKDHKKVPMFDIQIKLE